MNKIMLIGNLGKDPDMNYTQSGMAIARFTLAVNRYTKSSATGERQKETEWFNIVAMNKLAEICSEYLHKGTKVYIEGRLQQRKYTDKNNIERTAVEVIANEMEILTPKSATSSADLWQAVWTTSVIWKITGVETKPPSNEEGESSCKDVVKRQHRAANGAKAGGASARLAAKFASFAMITFARSTTKMPVAS